jgi:two-component system response regulator MprA
VSLVLVVDDDAVVREPVAASLRLAGYRTAAAADGKAALAIAVRDLPALVILDVSMPVMDGLTGLAALRSSAPTASVPVILRTASADKEFVEQAARLGVKDYLLKSAFSLPELLRRVKVHARDLHPIGRQE